MSWLDRDGAPFDQAVWDAIDAAVRSAADEVRAARRALPVVGPLGIAARVAVGDDAPVGDDDEAPEGEAHLHLPKVRTLPLIHRPFQVGVRGVEAFLARGEPLPLDRAGEAARLVARAEERLLFQGNDAAHVPGLLRHRGAVRLPLGDWSDPARAADDLLGALAALDAAGWSGPCALAVAPALYWKLFRPYPGTGLTPHRQLEPAFTAGIVKAPTLADAAVVVVRSPSGPRVVVGQELAVAYDGREGVFYQFSVAESVTLLQGAEGTVAVLERT